MSKAKELLGLCESPFDNDPKEKEGKRWILSIEGKSIDPNFEYSRGSQTAIKWLADLMAEYPGCEVTQLGYEDVSVMLPAGTPDIQALEVAHYIADKLPKESSWKQEHGADVVGDLYDVDSDGAALDIADHAKNIQVNKGDKLESAEPKNENTITEEQFISGLAFTSQTMTDEFLSQMYDKHQQLIFKADIEDILEVHLYGSPKDFPMNNIGTGWPTCMVDGDKIKLESSYGDGQESYILCKSAYLDTESSMTSDDSFGGEPDPLD